MTVFVFVSHTAVMTCFCMCSFESQTQTIRTHFLKIHFSNILQKINQSLTDNRGMKTCEAMCDVTYLCTVPRNVMCKPDMYLCNIPLISHI